VGEDDGGCGLSIGSFWETSAQEVATFPITAHRRKELERLSFQQLTNADRLLKQWFDIGLLEWAGTAANPRRQVRPPDVDFIRVMVQKRHILIHNGGVVDQEYLDNTARY